MTRSTLAASALLLCLAACSKSSGVPHLSPPESTAATTPAPAAEAYSAEAGDGEASVSGSVAELERSRPGLGTSFGETHSSAVRDVQFERADAMNPDALLSMRYNDAAGVQQLAQWKTGTPHVQAAARQTGMFSVTLRDESGRALPGAQIGGDVYAIGEAGARYTIGLENHSPYRFEAVASVDGLDVLDGDDAGFHKRGYVVAPYTSFAIEGWRTSEQTVAAFRFSDMDDAYAERVGKGRDIGVIGVALFRERGADLRELQRREQADPFPARYASPPPPRPYQGY